MEYPNTDITFTFLGVEGTQLVEKTHLTLPMIKKTPGIKWGH